jgi:hypothetical protein
MALSFIQRENFPDNESVNTALETIADAARRAKSSSGRGT